MELLHSPTAWPPAHTNPWRHRIDLIFRGLKELYLSSSRASARQWQKKGLDRQGVHRPDSTTPMDFGTKDVTGRRSFEAFPHPVVSMS